jgi:hypothetical protein
MAYNYNINLRVSAEMHAAILARARARDSDGCKVVREILYSALLDDRDPVADTRDQVLFAAIGIDGILQHLDPKLRADIVKIWQDKLTPRVRHVA